MLHGVEEEADSSSQQQVHGLIQQFGRKDAPYEEMVAQNSYQHNVGCSWHRPQQGQTVATMAHCNRAPAERKRIHQRGGKHCGEQSKRLCAVNNSQTSCGEKFSFFLCDPRANRKTLKLDYEKTGLVQKLTRMTLVKSQMK